MAFRKLIALVVVALLAVSVATFAADKKNKDFDTEQTLGKQGAEDAAKTLKFVNDPKYTARVEAIGQKLAAIAKTTPVPAAYGNSTLADFTYTFKVVDDKETNAFSLPAGYVYVNKGLIDRVESDDELAGVIAHEIAHVAHHHMLKLLQKQGQIDSSVLLIIAAAALGKTSGGDMANLYYGAKLVQMAKMNSWSQVAENDADTTAIDYLIRAKYNPVGMLTVMEGLAREESYNPIASDPTITRDHPTSSSRAKNIINQLNKRGIAIDRYAVESGTQARVRETTIKDKKVAQVVVNDEVIFTPADQPDQTSSQRAKSIADSLNSLLKQNPDQWEVRVSPDGTAVFLKQTLVVDVEDVDAALAGSTREALAAKTKASIQAAILSEQMRLMY